MRIAATFASIGAVFGEWSGSNAGLGYVMLAATPNLLTIADLRGDPHPHGDLPGPVRSGLAARADPCPMGTEEESA
jgi:hypothetical protein